MKALSVHNGRHCPNNACTVILFRKVVLNVCPRCETPGVVVEAFSMDLRKAVDGFKEK
jgi:uncharacterized Zn finger protein (UPF0148 family)